MHAYRNLSLKWKFCVLAVVLVGLMTVQGALVATGASGKTVPLILMCAGVVFGVIVTLATVPALHRDAQLANHYMTGAATATRLQLMTGLQALADGDLTVELRAGSTGTGAPPQGSRDEMGQMLNLTGDLRDTMIAAYDAYNRATAQLRELVDSVGHAAGNVHQASEQMSATSDESSRTSGEIAQAVGRSPRALSSRFERSTTPRRPRGMWSASPANQANAFSAPWPWPARPGRSPSRACRPPSAPERRCTRPGIPRRP